jgi:hypothetical protein
MWRASLLVFTTVAGALAIGAAVQAKPTSTSGCARAVALKSVFPKAVTVGFESRTIQPVGIDHPIGRWCRSWLTIYRGRPGIADAGATVVADLFMTRAQALREFAQSRSLGPAKLLPNGVRLRARVGTNDACVASVVRAVFIVSWGLRDGTCLQPTDYPGSEAVADQKRIHRRIHAAVLRLR